MRTGAILLLSAALIVSSPFATGQSFKQGLKQLGKNVSKQIEKKVEEKVINSVSKQIDKQKSDAKSGQNNAKNKQQTSAQSGRQTSTQSGRQTSTQSSRQTSTQSSRQTSTQSGRQTSTQNSRQVSRQSSAQSGSQTRAARSHVRFPQGHTALFAPLGYPVDATWGVKSIKPTLPPRDPAKQVNWVDKSPYTYTYDNQSLVNDFNLLNDAKEDGYIVTLTPADSRYEQILEEISERCETLNDIVKYYNLIEEGYNGYMDDDELSYYEDRLAELLDRDSYKRIIRSSIAPLFTLKQKYINEKTIKYFEAHGGYKDAVNLKLTVWDPKPDKKGISTSVSGQSGTVISEGDGGATVDIEGIEYVLHNSGRGGWAFASKAVNTAVAGKDIVIPDYIYYNGKRFPVESMRGGLFSSTSIKSIKLPNTLKELSNRAFAGTAISEIVIPASVKELKGSVFQNCSRLAKVVFEGDYMEEFSGSFQNCTSLTSVVCPRRVDMMSYDMFTGCTNLTNVVLPENLTEIPSSTFSGCKKLTKINIPATVTKIGHGAFANCGVTELDLRNVTEFEGFCFDGCKALKTVKLNSKLKEDFLVETYTEFRNCPLLQVKWENNQYVYPAGFIFIP